MTHSTEASLIHDVADAMIDLLTYGQWQRLRTAADRGGFDAGLKALTRVSHQLAAEKMAAAQDAAFQKGRLIGLQLHHDIPADVPARPRRVAVDSSFIVSVGFQRTSGLSGVLEIEFKSGAVHQYDDVPQGIVDDLLDGRSVGRFFTHDIKPFYTARRITAGV